MKKYRIGIDLGGTNIAAGIVDENYKIIKKASVPTNIPRPPEAIVADMVALAQRLSESAGISFKDEVESIGVGSPGIILNGVVLQAGNLRFKNVPLADMISKASEKQVTLKNDGNAAAYGEFIAGCGKGKHSLVAITLGTGVGGGIIINGNIIDGCGGSGGEVGHVVVKAGGRKCVCGNRGCLEAYCSATALKKDTVKAMKKNPDSMLWQVAKNIDSVSGRTAFDAMRLGDTAAKKLVDSYIDYLATGVASLINLFQPEVVCIGGGIGNEKETLTVPLSERVSEFSCSFDGNITSVVTATLGNDAGIIGAV